MIFIIIIILYRIHVFKWYQIFSKAIILFSQVAYTKNEHSLYQMKVEWKKSVYKSKNSSTHVI